MNWGGAVAALKCMDKTYNKGHVPPFPIKHLFLSYLQFAEPVLQPLFRLDLKELHLFLELHMLSGRLLFELPATDLQLLGRDLPQLLHNKKRTPCI